MSALWRWITLRHLFQEGGRTLLTLLGVALGVAVFVSIRLANHSAMSSFADTVDSVAGKSNLQIVSDSGGFDERVYARVVARIGGDSGILAAAPVVQTYAVAAFGGKPQRTIFMKGDRGAFNDTLLVLGIDFLSEGPFERFEAPKRGLGSLALLTDPNAAAVTRSLANRHHLGLGSTLLLLSGGRQVRLTVREIIDSPALQQAMGGSVVLTDIATAQEVFHRCGKLDRIDLLVDPARKDQIREALRPLLPPQARVELPQGRTRQVENMVSAFSLNLSALSFIALFVAMFLIFNAVSMSVLRRRREIGILRGLGVTRRQVIVQFLVEALFLGVVGSCVGLGLGTLLAKAALGSVARTITTLYLVMRAEHLFLDPLTYLQGFVLGVGMALVSALAPAIEASRTPPSVTVRQGTLIEAQPLPIRAFTAAGLLGLILAALLAWWTVGQHRPMGGFVCAFLLLGSFSLLAPGFTLLCESLLTPIAGWLGGIEGLLGARYLREAVARTSVVVAALMVSVGMTIGLTIMVGSFRKTVDIWVGQTIRGDLYVEPVGRTENGAATNLPAAVVRLARGLPGVADVDSYRGLQINYDGRLTHLAGVDFRVQRDRGRMQFLHGNSAAILQEGLNRHGVIVSESFTFRHGIGTGDQVTLHTPSGTVRLPVLGVFYDYSTDAGAIMMDYHLYARLWRDADRTESLALYLQPGADPDRVRADFVRREQALAGSPVVLYVTPNQSLRSRVMTVFDQTFQITYALQAISILVSVFGVITTLTALIVQRSREIGVLRAVGALRRQVRKMVLVESGMLGLIGAALGCVCGVALAFLLTYVINKQFFGWSIRMTIDPWLFVQATALMVGTALLSGLVPARMAASRLAAEAMRVD